MGIKRGPKLSNRNNMYLVFDPSNIKCYSGTGTVVTNLIKSQDNFNMVGSPTYVTSGNVNLFNLDASGERFESNTNTFFDNPSSMSIFAWYKLTGNAGLYRCVLHKGSDNSVGSSDFWIGASSNNRLTATIGANTGAGHAAGNTTTDATLNQWFFVGATWDGSTVKVYINGDYDKQYSLTTYTNVTNYTIIGAASRTTTYQVLGDIGQIMMWKNSVLTDDEIKDIYDNLKWKYQ